MLKRLSRGLGRFGRDASGASAIVFALSALPAIGAVGLGVDYYNGLAFKARLDAAADAAAVAAITAAQKYIDANGTVSDPTLTNNAIAAGQAQADKVFQANAGTARTYASVVEKSAVTRSGQTLNATVTYTGTLPNAFGKLFRVSTMNLSGHSGSSLTMGMYLDFYLALDMSGSMGLPTSTAGQQQLMAVNPDERSSYPGGCQFACHFPGNQGFDTAKKYGITLRVDSVGKAVTNLIQTAQTTQTLSNQYRIGLYPFITHVMEAAPLSSTYTNAQTVASQLGSVYLDTGLSTASTASMGSGGTHFENLFPDLYNYFKVAGDGSSQQKPKPFLFLVTDGADNNQTYDGKGNWTGSQPQRPTNLQYCAQAQQMGVTVSILYIPYQPIVNPNPGFAGDEDDKVNAVIPTIPADLKACASPGFFFTANSDTDITTAMQAMFSQALRAARLTQ